jgi:outer membrane protein assembly factor BamB
MKKHLLVVGIVFLFVGAGVVPATCIINENENVIKNQSQVESKTRYDSNSIDDYEWPKYHYDLNNSGFSPSPHAPETNNILWAYTTNFYVGCSPVVVNGKVYIGSLDEYFYCLNSSTGDKIWDYPIPGGASLCSACVMDGKVYVGAVYDYIYCWDAETGELIWKFYKGYSMCSSPAVVDGKVFIGVAGTENERIYCLDADTGDIVWDYNHSNYSVSEPAVVNGKVYIGTSDLPDDGIIFCFDADTGDILWNFTTNRYARGGPAVVDGKVYSSGNGMHCLDAETGEELWNFPDGNTTVIPAVAYDRIYFKTKYDAKIYCLDAGTGNELWNYPYGGNDLGGSSPAIADGKMYVGISSNGKLLCFDAYTGELIWDYKIEPGLSSPAVAYGNVYIGGGYSPEVFCFGGPSQPETPTIDGPNNGFPGTEYTYKFSTIDPQGDDIYYYIDWGDNSNTGWIGPYLSGEEITLNHTWDDSGVFIIKAKAKDTDGYESDWCELEVTMPRDKSTDNMLFWRLIGQFPLLQKLLLQFGICNN